MEVSTGLTCFSRIMLRLWELLFRIYLPCLNNTIQILVEFTHNNAIIFLSGAISRLKDDAVPYVFDLESKGQLNLTFSIKL